MWRSAFRQVVTHLGGVLILNGLDPGLLGSCWVHPHVLKCQQNDERKQGLCELL